MRVCVTGAGGFIGTHLVRRLRSMGCWVRGIDLHRPQWSSTQAHEFKIVDLRQLGSVVEAFSGIDWVFALASDMGGMRHITTRQSQIITNNTLIDVNTILAAEAQSIKRLFYSSSVCVYPMHLLDQPHPTALREDQIYPANPQETYGWEKLHMEHMLGAAQRAGKFEVRIARFHNTYGPESAWHPQDSRAKATTQLIAKIAIAKMKGDPEIEVWGDGLQTRAFMYVDDCVDGVIRLMESDYSEAVTLGPSRMISINDLVDLLGRLMDFDVVKKHVEGPQGVRGRNFDHTRVFNLGWVPRVPLEDGLKRTSQWITQKVEQWFSGQL